MKNLLKIGKTISFEKFVMSTNASDSIQTVTFSPNGADSCRGTLTQGAAGFVAAGTATANVNWKTLISFEYNDAGGKQKTFAFVMFFDPNGGGGAVVTKAENGEIRMTSLSENFYFEE